MANKQNQLPPQFNYDEYFHQITLLSPQIPQSPTNQPPFPFNSPFIDHNFRQSTLMLEQEDLTLNKDIKLCNKNEEMGNGQQNSVRKYCKNMDYINGIQTGIKNEKSNKLGRWSVREHFQYIEHVYRIFCQTHTQSAHKILKQLRKSIPSRSPRQLRQHHGRMIKNYGSVKKMIQEYSPHNLAQTYLPMLQSISQQLQEVRSMGYELGDDNKNMSITSDIRSSRYLTLLKLSPNLSVTL